MLLERVDGVVAALPDRLRHELLDAHDEHVLVVRAVEDADLAALRQHLVDAPEEVVRELGRVRRPEARDAHAHRVEHPKAVLDGAVLACGVHALQNDEDRARVAGGELVASSVMRSARFAVCARAVASSPSPSLASGLCSARSTFEPGRCAWRWRDPASRGRYATRSALSPLGERHQLDAIAERVVDESPHDAWQVGIAPRAEAQASSRSTSAPRAGPRTRRAGWAFVAGANRSATPTCS